MTIIDDGNRMKAAGDGYGKQPVTKDKFEAIVAEEQEIKGLTRAQLKKIYFVVD